MLNNFIRTNDEKLALSGLFLGILVKSISQTIGYLSQIAKKGRYRYVGTSLANITFLR